MVVALGILLGLPATLFVGYLILLLVGGLIPFSAPPAPVLSASRGTGEPVHLSPERSSDPTVPPNGGRDGGGGGIAVLIPAHDEELVIESTLQSVFAQTLPPAAVYVIADNCTDKTAELARAMGTTVLERTDTENRGKGWALAWAFERLLRETDYPAFVILDADTHAAPDFCERIADQLAAYGPDDEVAIQGRYGVLNENDGWRAALMSAAFALVNHIRLAGADRLGGFVGLKGNGMAFTRALLLAHPWNGSSITEDLDYALDLDRAGVRLRYAPEARVAAQMPVDARAAATQRRRWEGGRAQLALARGGAMLKARRIWAAMDLLTPPLGELCGLVLLWGLLTPFTPMWLALWWAAVTGGLILYVLGGLLISGVSGRVWVALACAPFYVAWKLAQRLTKPSREWIRTNRIPTGGPRP
ncbi:MAG: glycosyltransferase family 2 protein [Armatimonas sp.]